MVPLKVPLGGGHQTSGCRKCGEVFTSLTGFDKHQRDGQCLPPGQAGLVQHANRRWSLPGRVTGVTYTCTACNAEFTLRQRDLAPDEDVTYCPACISAMFSTDLHGSIDDPWTPGLLREVRFGP